MESLTTISRWLEKHHVVSWSVARDGELWAASAFYIWDREKAAFYLLSEESTRHAQMSGRCAPVAGTVNGQPRTIAMIRGVQFRGEICMLEDNESAALRERYCRCFPVARGMTAPVWELRVNELKFTDNTLGFGKKLSWLRDSGTE